jgi:NADPH2:quinone reductase
MPRAVVATGFGGPEVLSVIEVPPGEPGPGEIKVEVKAAGTNPIDYKLYSGQFGRDPASLPLRLGTEAAGVVSGVGGDARGPTGPLAVGDEVVLYRVDGAYADAVVVPGSTALHKPSTMTFEEAGGLMVTGVTATHVLTVIGVSRGDTVVIHGAGGGVGLMAVQLAVNQGARVIGTAGKASHDYLRQLGAEPVTYGGGLLERLRALAPDGVDAAIDANGSDEAIDTSIALVEDRQRIVTINSFQRGFALGLKVVGGAPGADPGTEIRVAARLQLVQEAAAGRLRVRVAGTYPLSEAAAAHRELALGHAHGKIVLVP